MVGKKLAPAMKMMTGNRRAMSEHRTAWEAMVFSQFVGPPHPALVRLRTVKSRGGLNASHATVASAKREGAVAGHQKLRRTRRPRLWHSGRGLTLRSRRGPTASRQARATGRGYIIRGPGLASYRRSRLNSNVRPRNRSRAVLQQSQRLSA